MNPFKLNRTARLWAALIPLTLVTFLHVFLWKHYPAAIKDDSQTLFGLSGITIAVGYFLLLSTFFLMVRYRLRPVPYHEWARRTVIAGFIYMGVFFILLSVAVVSIFINIGLNTANLDWSAGDQFLSAVSLSLYSIFNAWVSPPQVIKVPVQIKDWPHPGFKLAQISDIHIGPVLQTAFMQKVVDILNSIEPNAVAITGDLTEGFAKDIQDDLAPLKQLKTTDGVYFCFGNHEYFYTTQNKPNEWEELLVSYGLTVLKNKSVPIASSHPSHFGKVWHMAGVDDEYGDPDFDATLSGAAYPTVLLAHQPHLIDGLINHRQFKNVALQLSGHTHNGQIFPFKLLVRLREKYLAGLYRVAGMQLYVNQGTGFWGPPMRLLTRCEITLLEINPA